MPNNENEKEKVNLPSLVIAKLSVLFDRNFQTILNWWGKGILLTMIENAKKAEEILKDNKNGS